MSLLKRIHRFLFRLSPIISKKTYWNIRARNFASEEKGYQSKYYEQHQHIKDIFETSYLGSKRVLDAGCGFGRNTKFLIEECKVPPQNIYAFDFSSEMIIQANDYLSKYKNQLGELIQKDITQTNYPDNFFDIIIVHGVLMHLSSLNAITAVNELKRISKGLIIGIEENHSDNNVSKINRFTYNHNYSDLFFDMNTVELENKNLIMYTWEKG